MEEAKKRDHRKIGKELEIFAFDDEIGPGLPLWLPNGGIMIEENGIPIIVYETYGDINNNGTYDEGEPFDDIGCDGCDEFAPSGTAAGDGIFSYYEDKVLYFQNLAELLIHHLFLI